MNVPVVHSADPVSMTPTDFATQQGLGNRITHHSEHPSARATLQLH